ncbi:MAG: D-glycerate dehydrogenase [Deltaproteobacteria bacterium]|nr:D-glycerate dehydrogenase [Deltaproteobacteria bacterium]
MARILVTRELPGRGMVELRAEHEVLVSASIDEHAGAVEALICQLTERVDARTIERAKNLRALGNLAVGVDNIDVAAATARRVPVVNTPGVLTEATADFTMALLLAVARRVVEADSFVRSGLFHGWSHDLLLGADLSGRELGIVGLGRIGTAVAHRARGFGLEIVYASRTDHGDGGVGARRVPLGELLGGSDFVTLHVPLSAETHHLIGERELGSMKREAILINASRGPLVDEAALARALASGLITGAGLDVYEREPEVHPELLASTRVVLAPHLGSATTGTRTRMADLVTRGVAAVLGGERPSNVVNPQVWA